MEKVKVVRKDRTLYGEYDYVGFLKFRLERVKEYLEKSEVEDLYIVNKYGGIDRLDKYGNAVIDPFQEVYKMHADIVEIQMQIKAKEAQGEVTER